MIKNTLIDNTPGGITQPKKVFEATATTAITTMVVCNHGDPDLSDETINSATINIYVVPKADAGIASSKHLIVSKLIVPAGESVFFSDEKLILEDDDAVWVGASQTDPAIVSVTVSALLV